MPDNQQSIVRRWEWQDEVNSCIGMLAVGGPTFAIALKRKSPYAVLWGLLGSAIGSVAGRFGGKYLATWRASPPPSVLGESTEYTNGYNDSALGKTQVYQSGKGSPDYRRGFEAYSDEKSKATDKQSDLSDPLSWHR